MFFLDRDYLLTRHVDPELGNAFGTFGYRRFGTFGYRRERDEGLELDGAQAGRFGAHSVPGRVGLCRRYARMPSAVPNRTVKGVMMLRMTRLENRVLGCSF